jgi:glycosyltransferase involved in cell wall biosynthesis
MTRPRVLFLVLQHGGLGLYGVCFARYMARYVDARILVSPELYSSDMVRSHLQGTDTVVFQSAADLFSSRSVRAIRELLQEIDRFSPDAVHETIGYSNKQLLLVRPLLHRRYSLVVTVHDPVPHSGMSNWITEFSRVISHRFSDKLVVHGPWCKQRLQATGADEQKIIQMHLGPLEILKQEKGGEQEKNFQILDVDSNYVLFFGALRVNKGILELPQIVRLVKQQEPQATFVVAGNSNHYFADSAWKAQMEIILGDLRSMGVTVYDRYIPDEEVAPLFQHASIVVLPYRDASQSAVAALAGMFGRAGVATDVGDLPSAILHNKTGRIVPAGDIARFADEVVQILQSPHLMRQYGEAARLLYAEGQNSWKQAAKILLPHYKGNRDGRK